MLVGFRRDRLTWVAYVVGAWFAYLQAAPGLVVVHLRDELDLSYAAGGLHVAAFAAGSTVAGLFSARLEGWLGRRKLLWSAAALLGAGVVGLTLASIVGVTIGSVVGLVEVPFELRPGVRLLLYVRRNGFLPPSN